jgi:bifunctional non-homologous end joining protein LigD
VKKLAQITELHRARGIQVALPSIGKAIGPVATVELTGKTVVRRRERLEQIITPVPGIQVSGYVEERGKDLFQLAKERGLEGIIAKHKTSIYRPGRRSPDWLKIKSRPQQEFAVCGFTEGKGSRKHFGALLLGAYRNGKLRYFGHSGTGFSEKGLAEAIDRLCFFANRAKCIELFGRFC